MSKPYKINLYLFVFLLINSFVFSHFAIARPSDPLNVVVSIAPLHSIVAEIMNGAGEPSLIISGGISPHHFVLKPSMVKKISQADLVVVIDQECFETGLSESVAKQAKSVMVLTDVKGLTLLKRNVRQHGHDGHDGHDGHSICMDDPHFWLNPINLLPVIDALSQALAQLDPDNKPLYFRNASVLRDRIMQLDQRLRKTLSQLEPRAYLVFHDGFQYFENRYKLNHAGVIKKNTALNIGIKRIKKLRKIINQSNVQCIFTEPQFSHKISQIIAEGRKLKVISLSILGGQIYPGVSQYFQLMNGLEKSFVDCFTGE
jgi:zinc transport system substrate-binding protein